MKAPATATGMALLPPTTTAGTNDITLFRSLSYTQIHVRTDTHTCQRTPLSLLHTRVSSHKNPTDHSQPPTSGATAAADAAQWHEHAQVHALFRLIDRSLQVRRCVCVCMCMHMSWIDRRSHAVMHASMYIAKPSHTYSVISYSNIHTGARAPGPSGLLLGGVPPRALTLRATKGRGLCGLSVRGVGSRSSQGQYT